MTYEDVLKKYQPTIGIECHVQLKTKTKLFSGADNDSRDKSPNVNVSPICFGLPGVLPVLNEAALGLAVKAGLAMNAMIPRVSRFERKHYFYPDLPKGYQMTQLAEPVIVGGKLDVPQVDGSSKIVRIHHAHLEEDAGKLTHPAGANYSLVDLNRAGTPLIEIVSEADMHSPAEARAYANELYLLMTYAGVTDGDLYHGNMRFDVNISLAPIGETKLGTRAEIKNLNSFRSVEKAAEYEAVRQAELLDAGETVVQETRGWDEAKQKTVTQRSKEDAHDYRYMPEPDVPPVIIEADEVKHIEQSMPVLPPEYRHKWQGIGLNQSVINALLATQPVAKLITEIMELDKGAALKTANWFASGLDEEADLSSIKCQANDLVKLATMTSNNELSSTGAKQIFNQLIKNGGDPEDLAKSRGLLQTNDASELEAIVDQVLADPIAAKAIEDVKSGQEKAIGFLVGQCMKASKGQGNPAIFQKMLKSKLK